MGDIWIVTIDKSGSMLHGTNAQSLSNNVYRRLIFGDCFKTADFSKDRFLFLTSGFSFSTAVGMGNELRRAPSFDVSFIHPTDNKLHSFNSKQECALYIKSILAENDYDHLMSFVSQIRVFSIIHANNLLKKIQETDSFNSFKVLTITDDADQNDQWRTDYKTLKKCAPGKVKEVSDSTSKYIYNSISGEGFGNLEEIFSDEKNVPHIWLYSYQSKDQYSSIDELDLFSVKAADGESFVAKAKRQHLYDDEVTFFHIDSIQVNNKRIIIDTSFTDALKRRCQFDNGIKTNKTTIWGFAQVRYHDRVFGNHFKAIPFTQNTVVFSRKLQVLLNAFLFIITLTAIGLLLFFLLIRPNYKLFTIVSPLGKKTTVKRGFSSSWKGDYIPIQCYQNDGKTIFGSIIKKHRCIINEKIEVASSDTSELLICSRFDLGISVKTVCHSTADDIERIYFSRTGDYSTLLRREYETTAFFKLYRQYITAPRKWQQKLIHFYIGFLNCFWKKYYYVIDDISSINKLYVSADSVLYGKRFIIEYHRADDTLHLSMTSFISQIALTRYYNDDGLKYDIILSSHSENDIVYWIVLQLDDYILSRDSLRTVSSLIRFKQTERLTDKYELAQVFMRVLKTEFPHKRLGYIDTNTISLDSEPFSFDIKESSAPGYISYIETTTNPRVQLMYSPLKDTDTTEKFIKLNTRLKSGHLYLSAVPIRKYPFNASFTKLLSKDVINCDEKHPSLLKLSKDYFEFRGINVTY